MGLAWDLLQRSKATPGYIDPWFRVQINFPCHPSFKYLENAYNPPEFYWIPQLWFSSLIHKWECAITHKSSLSAVIVVIQLEHGAPITRRHIAVSTGCSSCWMEVSYHNSFDLVCRMYCWRVCTLDERCGSWTVLLCTSAKYTSLTPPALGDCREPVMQPWMKYEKKNSRA